MFFVFSCVSLPELIKDDDDDGGRSYDSDADHFDYDC